MTLLLDSLLVVLTAAAITLLLGVAIVFVTVTMFFAVFASGQEPWGFTKGDPRSIFWVVPEIYFPEPGFSVGRYIRGDISEQEDSKLRYICKGREVTDQKGCPLHQNKKSWHHILRLWNILVTHRGMVNVYFFKDVRMPLYHQVTSINLSSNTRQSSDCLLATNSNYFSACFGLFLWSDPCDSNYGCHYSNDFASCHNLYSFPFLCNQKQFKEGQ